MELCNYLLCTVPGVLKGVKLIKELPDSKEYANYDCTSLPVAGLWHIF